MDWEMEETLGSVERDLSSEGSRLIGEFMKDLCTKRYRLMDYLFVLPVPADSTQYQLALIST